MAQLLVRGLEDDVKERLRDLASSRGHSMEEEAREILRRAVVGEPATLEPLGTRIAARFRRGGVDVAELRGGSAKPARLR